MRQSGQVLFSCSIDVHSVIKLQRGVLSKLSRIYICGRLLLALFSPTSLCNHAKVRLPSFYVPASAVPREDIDYCGMICILNNRSDAILSRERVFTAHRRDMGTNQKLTVGKPYTCFPGIASCKDTHTPIGSHCVVCAQVDSFPAIPQGLWVLLSLDVGRGTIG